MTDDPRPPLTDIFLSELADAARSAFPDETALADWLDESIDAGRKAWPDLSVADEVFVRYLAVRVATPEIASVYRQLRTADLYFACSCALGDPAALKAFEERYFVQVERALTRMKLAPTVVDDLRGSIRETLFFPRDENPPLILQYGGRGDLGSWVRSVAVRAALKDVRSQNRNVPVREEDLSPAFAASDPEIAYLRSLYSAELQGALQAALESLSGQERTLLRQHYLDGLSVRALGKIHRVHAATAARWVVDARTELMTRTRAQLATRLALTDSGFESVLRLVRSDLDLSISRILRTGP